MADRIFRIDMYPTEWLVHTGHMTLEQRGIFVQICMLIYSTQKRIPNDPAHIARVSNCSPRMARAIIDQLFASGDLQLHDGFIGQKRCESELNIKRTHLEHSAKGGRNKYEKERENNKNNNLNSSDTQNSLASPPYPTLPHSKKEESVKETLSSVSVTKPPRKRPAKDLGAYTPEFEAFWVEYPTNNGPKKSAFEKYLTTINQGISHETLIAGARAYRSFTTGRRTETRYIKHAATWHNQRGWESNYTDVIPPHIGASLGAGRPGKSEQARSVVNRALGLDDMEDHDRFGHAGPEKY